MTSPADLEVVIIGGGPAGSAAAIELARSGRRVAILERSLTMHDKVCGDFLSEEAVDDLEQLGVSAQRLNAAAIQRVSLVGSLGHSSATLPFAAQSVTRRALDEALLRCAAEAGVLVLRGHAAQSVHRADSVWHVDIASPRSTYTLRAADVVLATGKHDLRGLPRPEGGHSGLVGLKMYLRLERAQIAALAGLIEVVLLKGGYGGLSLVEDDVANLCFVVDRAAVRALGNGWGALAAMLYEQPHLRRRLEGAEPLLARPLAISPIPYGFVRSEAIAPGLWSVGDQAVVIPSFTGDGVALALHSGRLAAQMMLEARSAEEFQRLFSVQVRRQVARATILSRALIAQPQRALVELTARLWPGVLRAVATSTRLPPKCRISQCESSCTAA
jgi:flavin-dependent dehydrogenase